MHGLTERGTTILRPWPNHESFLAEFRFGLSQNSRSFFIHQELQSKKGIKKNPPPSLPDRVSRLDHTAVPPTEILHCKWNPPHLFSYIPTWSLHFQHPFLQGRSFKSEDSHVFHTSGNRWLVQSLQFLLKYWMRSLTTKNMLLWIAWWVISFKVKFIPLIIVHCCARILIP